MKLKIQTLLFYGVILSNYCYTGSLPSKQSKEEATLLPYDVTKQILGFAIDKATTTGDLKTMYSLALVNKNCNQLIKPHITSTEEEKAVVKKYKDWLKNTTKTKLLIKSKSTYNPSWTILVLPKKERKTIWEEEKENISLTEKVKTLKQFILFEFFEREDIGLHAARVAIALFKKHNVDLNAIYNRESYTGYKHELPKLYDPAKYPFSHYSLLGWAQYRKRCPAIVQALKEADAKILGESAPLIDDL